MLKIILEFIYTTDIEISGENVCDILAAASSVELIALEEKCANFLGNSLSIANCVEIFLNAYKYHLDHLWAKAMKFICVHFEEVPIEDIQHIDGNNFQEVLKHDEIAAAETIVFDRLVQWMDHNKIGVSKLATDMLKLIRLAHIPIAVSRFILYQNWKFLIRIFNLQILTESIEHVYETNDCAKMVMNEYRKRLLNNKAIVLHRYAPKEIYCSFLNSSSNGIVIKKYDFAKNNWNEYKKVPFGATRYCFGSIVLNGELFVMGGYNQSSIYLNIVSVLNY